MNVKKVLLSFGCILTVLGMASMTWGHHAAVGYDRTKRLIFKGSVEEFAWVNPHAFIFVNVKKKDGSTELWGFETGGATRLNRSGWKKSDFSEGTEITIYATAARNGNHNALTTKVVFADGRELQAVDTGVAGASVDLVPGNVAGTGRAGESDYVNYE